MTVLADRYEALTDFTHDSTEKALAELAVERNVGKGKIIHPTRLAVSGSSRGPGLYEMLVTLGKPIVIERLRKAVAYIRNKT